MQFDEVLRTWQRFFEAESIRYALIGGLAMQAWGRSRFTKDADFAIARRDHSLVVAHAESLGYETLHVSTGYSNHLHSEPALGRIDFMYVDDATADKLFDRAVVKPLLGDISIPVASPEHLAMMKVIAIKNNPPRAAFEGEDIRLLLSVPGVDREAVAEYFESQGMLDFLHAIERAR